LVVWLVGWLVGLVGWVSWLVGWLVALLVGYLEVMAANVKTLKVNK